ncbi:hypothetical protein JJE66_15755 [Bradyrhizobium diazoefficiens]|uniref:hypothetical protein n=1 Tax=Bradyrhizobium diazoefficiens TaxID=1355477 RepID=UPI001909A6BF|nr:hypothetical protein [Bradyrhizobium diazoefficiens]MBK3662687.1 hypothetical protein [Bradyrhizobium diazoefficiens]
MFRRALSTILIIIAPLATAAFFASNRIKPTAIRGVMAPTVPIATLLANKDAYANSTIKVSGTVTSQGRVGLLGYSIFRIQDPVGSAIMVVSSSNNAPPVGAEIAVVGQLKSAIQLGSYDLPVLIQQ